VGFTVGSVAATLAGTSKQSKESAGYFVMYGREVSRREVNALAGTFTEDFNWGLTKFDSFPEAFVTSFQVITLEG
jgi:hypothetical protein